MNRKPSTFRQGDITRAVKAVTAAGLAVVGVKISAKGDIEVITAGKEHEGANEWDRL